MKLTPSQVKNIMRRGLRLLVDPEPERKDRARVALYFEHKCAYCGLPVEKGGEDLDHLVSSSCGGTNHISNRVFSCKRCNSKEKRDVDWQEFLRRKSGQGREFRERKRKIEKWVKGCGGVRMLSEPTLKLLEKEGRRLTATYDDACRKVRSVRPAAKPMRGLIPCSMNHQQSGTEAGSHRRRDAR